MAPKSLPERARAARIRAGFSNEAAAAKAIGCARPTVIRWETDAKSIGNYLLRAAKAYNVRPEWLAMESDDDGYPHDFRAYKPTPARDRKAVREPETTPGYVRFQLLDGFVSAGDGGYVPDYPEVVREISVAEEWARRNLAAPHHRIRVVTAQGDSMQPEIGSGDVLFVDSGVTFYDTDAVYVMNWQGRPIVKRLQMKRDGTLVIKSANPSYESESVPAGEIDQLFITGRVIGVWQFRAH